MKKYFEFSKRLLIFGASCVPILTLPIALTISCSKEEKIVNIYVKKNYNNDFIGSVDKENWWYIGRHYIAQQWELEKGVEILNNKKEDVWDVMFDKDMRRIFNIKNNQDYVFVVYRQ